MNFYKKVKFTKKIEEFVVSTLEKVSTFVLEKDSECELYDYWGICENADAEIVTKKTTNGEENRKLKTNINEVLTYVPELEELFSMLNLHPFVGKNLTANFPIHRHVYNPQSKWALCLLLGENNNGVVNFYKLSENSNKPELECSVDYMYDQLLNNEPVVLVSQLNVKSNEIYCINVWEWHNFVVPNNEKVSVYLLYFKDGLDINYINTYLKKYEES